MTSTINAKYKSASLGSFLKIGSLLFCTAFMSIYLEIFREYTLGITHSFSNVCLRAVPVFVVFMILGYLFLTRSGSVLNKIFKFRYIIGLALFCVALIFELSGSSIGIWETLLPSSDGANVVWGTYRDMRGDEFGVGFPFSLSQTHNSFAPVSDIVRGTETSVTLLPALPSFSLAALFKPSFWGFLLFGASRGLAWQWSLYYIGLFLITIELFLILTRNNRSLSILAAFLVTFSPCTQWWNTTDVLLFGESIIVCIYYFLTSHRLVVKIVLAFLFTWLCFCFLFIAYPAWLITYFYVFSIMGIWIIISSRTTIRESFNHLFSRNRVTGLLPILVLVCSLVAFATISIFVFDEASLAIEGMSNTIYPGQRSSVGGEKMDYVLNWIPSLFYSLSQSGFDHWNECELSAFLSLFPLSFIISCAAIYKYRNSLLIALIILSAIYFIYFTVGIPEIISKLTLLSMTTSSRIILPWGYINICLLLLSINSLFCGSNEHRKKSYGFCGEKRFYLSLCIILVLTLTATFALSYFAPTDGIPDSFWTVRFVLLLVLIYLAIALSLTYLCIFRECNGVRLFSLVLCGIAFVVGISVNPIQQGISVITDNEAYITIEDIVDEDPEALWISEGGSCYSNFCAAAGARTLSSTNTYPNIDLWSKLDPAGDYEEIYLRYANIKVDIEKEFEDAKFELVSGDAIALNLTPLDLKEIGVKYLLADETHTDIDGIHFKELYSATSPSREFIIYELVY